MVKSWTTAGQTDNLMLILWYMHTQTDYKTDRADRQLDGCYYPMELSIDFLWALRDLADKEASFGQ